jgi:hypothetical protein
MISAPTSPSSQVRRVGHALLQAYWRLTPSAAQRPCWCRDVRLLTALVASAAGAEYLGGRSDPGGGRSDLGGGRSDGGHGLEAEMAHERRALAEIALALLSLLALHLAPLPLLADFLARAPDAAAAGRSDVHSDAAAAERVEPEWSQIGVVPLATPSLATPSAAAAEAIGRFDLPDAHAPTDVAPLLARSDEGAAIARKRESGSPVEVHARLQRAAAAPLPSMLADDTPDGEPGAGVDLERTGEAPTPVAAWAQKLFEWDTFPLHKVPHVLRDVLHARAVNE